jgi:hypothetical protein
MNMRSSKEDRRESWVVRVLFWLPFRKRYDRAEYAELFRLLGSETKVLRRRPAYLLGSVVSLGLAVYFLVTSTRGASIDWWGVVVGILIGFGYTCGINSVREHLCERLLRLKQHPEELERI